MKKLILLSVIIITMFSCSKVDNTQNSFESFKFKSLSVNVTIPSNSNISLGDLSVSSLFTENSQITEGATEIESFNDNSMELTFATNSQENIVLLSYFNPISSDVVDLSIESTAVALIMLNPWTFDLSVNAKADAIEFIKSLPEFESLKNVLETNFKNGELNPINTIAVLEKVTNVQAIVSNRTTEYIAPLTFNFQNSTATIINEASSASYSIGLYNQNNELLEHKIAIGLDKTHQIYQDYISNNYQYEIDNEQTVQFDIPSDGDWTLKAKSGLSFDGSLENQQAAFYNAGNLGLSILGIISPKLKKAIKNGECIFDIGQNIYNGVNGSVGIATSFEEFNNGTISGYDLTLDGLSFMWTQSTGVYSTITDCASNSTELFGIEKLKNGSFDKILKFLDLLGNLENAFNGGAMLGDWIIYDNEIDYCFTKNGNTIGKSWTNNTPVRTYDNCTVTILDANLTLTNNILNYSFLESDSCFENENVNNVIDLNLGYNQINETTWTGLFFNNEIRHTITITNDTVSIRLEELYNGQFDTFRYLEFKSC